MRLSQQIRRTIEADNTEQNAGFKSQFSESGLVSRFDGSPVRDRQLQEGVLQALRCTPYPLLSTLVHVRAASGCVELDGRVPSYYLKQVAQTVAMRVDGVERLRNDLQVGDAESRKFPEHHPRQPR